MFKGIWSGIKAIFGADTDGTSNVMRVAEGIGGWVDSQQFTEQEKAELNAKLITSYGEYMESTVKENTRRSATRRDIAIWVIRTELLWLTASLCLYKFDADWAAYIYKIATTNPMNFLVLGVGAFFFGAHIIRQVKG